MARRSSGSSSRERSLASWLPRRFPRFSCTKRQAAWLAGVCLTVAQAGVSRAEFNITGDCPLLCDEANDTCITGCPSTPLTCRAGEKSSLRVRQRGDPGKNKLTWKWIHGAQTTQAEFADPTATTDYALCVFAGSSPALVAEALIGADASKWSIRGTRGYKYADSTAAADGINSVLLRGGDQGQSSVRVKGNGGGLPTLPLSIIAPVTVQILNGDNGLCWGASYTASQLLRNDTEHLEARTP